jgi:hypothetical protein
MSLALLIFSIVVIPIFIVIITKIKRKDKSMKGRKAKFLSLIDGFDTSKQSFISWYWNLG